MFLSGEVRIGVGEQSEIDSTDFVRDGFELPENLLPIYLLDRAAVYHETTHADTRVIPSSVAEEELAKQWEDLWKSGEIMAQSPRTPYQNRVHSRLVLRDYGVPIYRFTSMKELLGAFRDAIAGEFRLPTYVCCPVS